MSSKLDTLDMVIYGAGLLLFIGSIAGMFLEEVSAEHHTVTNTVTDKVIDNSAIVTETEVYKIVCVQISANYCKEYSVRRIVKE